MISIQPYLPWALGIAALLLLHFWFRGWSVRYSDKVVNQLKGQQPVAIQGGQEQVAVDNSPLGVHRQIIWEHVATLPPDNEQRIASLVGDLALVKLLRQFENAHYQIFASQVFFLRNLNLVKGSAQRPEVEKFFQDRANQNPELKKIAFDAWLRFLVEQAMVIEDATGIRITPLGEEFLVWMVRNKIPDKSNERF